MEKTACSAASSPESTSHSISGIQCERGSGWMMLWACSSWWQCCWQGWRGWSAWRCPGVLWASQQVRLVVAACVGCLPRNQLHFVACKPGATPLCHHCVPGASWRGLGCLPATLWGASRNLGPAACQGMLLSQLQDGPAPLCLLNQPNCCSLGGARGPFGLPAISLICWHCLGHVPQQWLAPAAEGDTETQQ